MLTFDKEDLEEKGFVLDDERSERGWQEVTDADFRRDNKTYEPDTYYKLKSLVMPPKLKNLQPALHLVPFFRLQMQKMPPLLLLRLLQVRQVHRLN